MKAIVNTARDHLEWQDLPTPVPGPGQVRIRTLACGICATDLEMIAGWDRTGFPSIPGHEWCGQVDALGPGAPAALAGCRCVAENVIADGGEVGFEHPGGYGQFFLTEAANVRVLPPDFPPDVGALIEPLAVVVRGLRRLRLRDYRRALVFGDGPIGLLTVLLLQRAGVRRIAVVGGREVRLRLARELGAALLLNYHQHSGELGDELAEVLGSDFPVIIEASGSTQGVRAALQLAGRGGKVLVLGDYGNACAVFPWNHLLHRELELIGSNASAGAWPEAVRFARAEHEALRLLISANVPAPDFQRGFDLLRTRKHSLVKVILCWEDGHAA